MLVKSRNQYALRVHDHVIRVVMVAIDHILIEAVELPQDLSVHIYWLVGLDTHVTPLNQNNMFIILI